MPLQDLSLRPEISSPTIGSEKKLRASPEAGSSISHGSLHSRHCRYPHFGC